jgi:rubrerythrin
MIAQRKHTNEVVDMSDEATVQAAVTLLSRSSTQRPPTLLSYRWFCEICGMVHAGSAPAICESCGGSLALAHQDDICREMGSRW